MKVILRTDVEGVGNAGDVLDVADGYARNCLVPKGFALRATEGTMAQAAAMQRARDVKDTRAREAAEEIARKLVPMVIAVEARVGSGDHLYGSVTTTEIAEAVLAQTEIDLDRRKMSLDEPIKTVGTHEVGVRLHPEVRFSLTVEVAPAS